MSKQKIFDKWELSKIEYEKKADRFYRLARGKGKGNG